MNYEKGSASPSLFLSILFCTSYFVIYNLAAGGFRLMPCSCRSMLAVLCGS